MLRSIDHVRLCAVNLVESKKWYEKVLGTKPYIDVEGFVEFRIEGGCGLAIGEADEKSPFSTGGCIGYWNVDNLEGSIDHFKAHGAVVYRGPLEIEDGKRICQIKDPFGNVIGLVG